MGNADKQRVANEAEHVSTANCPQSPRMIAPNRTEFERNLSRLNKATDHCQEQMKKHWNEANRNEINRQRDIFTNLQQSFQRDSIDEKRLSLELNEQIVKHSTKQREIHEMEDTDMTYKNLVQAQQKLAFAEDRYNKQNFASVREEKAQVAEIDRIKRNISKLSKYVPLVEERKSLETAIKDLRQEIRSIRSKMRFCRDQMYDCRKKIREIKTPYIEMKKRMYKFNEEKRQIIKQYEQERQNYIVWLQQNNIRGVPSTFPTAIIHEDPLDNFEPFFEQKKTCAKLIRYLRSLKRNCEPVSSESHAANSELSDSSADEFPESFKVLKINPVDSQQNSNTSHSRKKSYVKKYVKKTQPVTHSFDFIKLFHDVQVDFPGTYAEVDEAIVVVQEKLNYYNDQTNLEHLEEIERADSPFSSMLSHNGSDLMDMSFISSPRSESSASLVILDESNLLQEESSSLSDLNFHFPKIRDVN